MLADKNQEVKDEILDSVASLSDAVGEISQDAQKAAIELETLGENAVKVDPREDARFHVTQECVKLIRLLNTIMGNTPLITRNPAQAVNLYTNQEKLFIEERNESIEALRAMHLEEVIDGNCDMIVVQQGFDYLCSPISVEDIDEGRAPEGYAGHVGSLMHSVGGGVISNVIRQSMMDSVNVVRMETEKLFVTQLGVDPEVFLDGIVKALHLVCLNNLSKATCDEEEAEDWYNNLTEGQITVDGYHLRSTEIDGVKWYALFDNNGKFRKHNKFVGVDLKPVLAEMLKDVKPELIPDQIVAEAVFKAARGGVA